MLICYSHWLLLAAVHIPASIVSMAWLQVHADYRLSATNQSLRFALTDMQVDNQLLTSSQPVVLARARQACAPFQSLCPSVRLAATCTTSEG